MEGLKTIHASDDCILGPPPYSPPENAFWTTRVGTHFGILEVTLHPAGYDWQFVSDDGTVLDAGSDTRDRVMRRAARRHAASRAAS